MFLKRGVGSWPIRWSDASPVVMRSLTASHIQSRRRHSILRRPRLDQGSRRNLTVPTNQAVTWLHRWRWQFLKDNQRGHKDQASLVREWLPICSSTSLRLIWRPRETIMLSSTGSLLSSRETISTRNSPPNNSSDQTHSIHLTLRSFHPRTVDMESEVSN